MLIETIHLIEQLKQNTLHFPIRAGLRIEPLRSNGVHLIDEDDAGRVLPRQAENISDHPRAL